MENFNISYTEHPDLENQTSVSFNHWSALEGFLKSPTSELPFQEISLQDILPKYDENAPRWEDESREVINLDIVETRYGEAPGWDEDEQRLDIDIALNTQDRRVVSANNSEIEESKIPVINVAYESNNEVSDVKHYEDGTRELTENEKKDLQEKLGWSDEKLKKCTIDEEGMIHYKTDRCDLEGKTSENGVPYERKVIEINGVKIEGVFPKFESSFDTSLSEANYKSKAYAKECNQNLRDAIRDDPDLKSSFTSEQIEDIEAGRTPREYVWHHNEEPGKMQLVKRKDHDRTMGGAAHTGGNSLWGSESGTGSKKGESF